MMSKLIPDFAPAFSVAAGSLLLAGCSLFPPASEPVPAVLPTTYPGYPTPALVHAPAIPASGPVAAPAAASAAATAFPARPQAPVVRTRRSSPAPATAPVPARPAPRMICEDSKGNEVACPPTPARR